MQKPERIDLEELRERTLASKQAWYDAVAEVRYLDPEQMRNAYLADEDTIRRWMVNYIRHEMTDYDFEVFRASMPGRIGRRGAFSMFEEVVYENIASVYPELKDECERQLAGK